MPRGRFTETLACFVPFSTIRTRNQVGAALRAGGAASARGGRGSSAGGPRLGHLRGAHGLLHQLEVVLGTVGGGGRRERRHQDSREQRRLHGSSYSIQTWMRSPSSPSMVRISAGPVFLSRCQNVRAS